MNKYSFLNDYSEGCHPDILANMSEHNLSQKMGYGEDIFSEQAKAMLKDKANAPNAEVYFMTGGTQTNLVCLASMLKPFEAIISASTGHIVVNEAGAIEATGHKIISVPSTDGKLTPEDIETILIQFTMPPHKVRAKVVYISNATETGTVYSKSELTALSECCHKHGLYLCMDGARLGVALANKWSNLTLADVAELTDMFWLGGTKMGALLGEAIVITRDELQTDFPFHLKQRGALLAKGSVLGLQFTTLLNDDLYLKLSEHANQMAIKISQGIEQAGYSLVSETQSNLIFAVLPHTVIADLQKDFIFYEWEKRQTDSVVRLVTSWATDENQVDRFVQALA